MMNNICIFCNRKYIIRVTVGALIIDDHNRAIFQPEEIVQTHLICFHCWKIRRQDFNNLRNIHSVCPKGFVPHTFTKDFGYDVFILVCNRIFHLTACLYLSFYLAFILSVKLIYSKTSLL